MKEWMRQTDQLARLGGDEFAALLFQADRTTARQVVDRIRATVAELRLAGGGEAPLTLSVGIALFPSDGGDAEWLLVRAEQALGEAKRRGGNRVMLAEDVPRSAGGDEQSN
jgi:diguanylate cyclase (GGDEF)-like protein